MIAKKKELCNKEKNNAINQLTVHVDIKVVYETPPYCDTFPIKIEVIFTSFFY